MENEQMRTLLTALLGCGSLDLRVLEDCKYYFDELIERTKDMGYEKPDLNNLAYAMFDQGKSDIVSWIENRIEDLEVDGEEDNKEELEALRQLEPHEDIESFHNFLDTSVYFTNRQELYKKYCSEALEAFEADTGFSLT